MDSKPRFTALIAGLASVLALVPVPSSGQDRSLPLTPVCPSCQLELEPLLTFDSREDSHALVPLVQGLTFDARRRVWMAMGARGPVHVFGANGELEGTVGRQGQGPGEFTAPMAVVAFGDSVAVFDPGSGLVSIFDMELGFARSIRVPGQVFRGVAGEGSVVIENGSIQTREAAGYPFHVLDLSTGEVLRSFGGEPGGAFGPRDLPLMVGFIDRDPVSGDVWTSLRHRPVLQRWDSSGRHIETVELEMAWFPQGLRASIRTPSTPPDAAISGLAHDGRRLWVAFQVPNHDWRRAWTADPPTSGPFHPRPQDLPARNALFSGRMVVLDADARQVQGSWDTELLPALAATPSGAFVELKDSDSLYPVLTIVRPRPIGLTEP